MTPAKTAALAGPDDVHRLRRLKIARENPVSRLQTLFALSVHTQLAQEAGMAPRQPS